MRWQAAKNVTVGRGLKTRGVRCSAQDPLHVWGSGGHETSTSINISVGSEWPSRGSWALHNAVVNTSSSRRRRRRESGCDFHIRNQAAAPGGTETFSWMTLDRFKGNNGIIGLGPSIVMTTKISRTLYDDNLTRLTQGFSKKPAQNVEDKRKCTRICVEGEWKTIKEKNPPCTQPGYNPDLPVLGSLVQHESSALDLTTLDTAQHFESHIRTQINLGGGLRSKDKDLLPSMGKGDEATLVRGHFQTQVFQQSVTLTAKMWPEDNGTAPPSSPGGWKWGSWRIPNEHLPLLVGTVCGGALILLVLLAAIVWRCCVMPRRDKAYCARLDKEMLARQRAGIPPLPSHSAVFAAPKSGQWAYSSRLVGPPANPPLVAPPAHWFYNSRVLSPANLERIDPGPIPRSVSCVSTQLHNEALPVAVKVCDKRRPMSQPIRFGPCDLAPKQEARHPPLPEISEFTAPNTQYASSSILDEVGARGGEAPAGNMVLKTRSLPAWVRSRSRPLSTEDDLAELYAKVNFSKKRKNRMRNDEAAIIALSKSRSQYLHKDTDSLVDNEAVIVYDERTALFHEEQKAVIEEQIQDNPSAYILYLNVTLTPPPARTHTAMFQHHLHVALSDINIRLMRATISRATAVESRLRNDGRKAILLPSPRLFYGQLD
uniref:Uncharacterized protein n=1 Tax=Timema bartmani TaxID=61472 RepID=A0A7R9HX92_9NEOP|nr:unnamed protein product [Timema bartmani]